MYIWAHQEYPIRTQCITAFMQSKLNSHQICTCVYTDNHAIALRMNFKKQKSVIHQIHTFIDYFLFNHNKTIVLNYEVTGTKNSLKLTVSQWLWSVCVLTDQVDGSLVEGGGLQDLLHGDCLQFVRVQLFTLVRNAIIHDHGERAHSCLLVVRPAFLVDGT